MRYSRSATDKYRARARAPSHFPAPTLGSAGTQNSPRQEVRAVPVQKRPRIFGGETGTEFVPIPRRQHHPLFPVVDPPRSSGNQHRAALLALSSGFWRAPCLPVVRVRCSSYLPYLRARTQHLVPSSSHPPPFSRQFRASCIFFSSRPPFHPLAFSTACASLFHSLFLGSYRLRHLIFNRSLPRPLFPAPVLK